MSNNTLEKNILEENRLDDLLTKLINGDTSDFEPLNRLEQYLFYILAGKDITELGKPLNRLEALLQALSMVVPENSVEILAARLEEQ